MAVTPAGGKGVARGEADAVLQRLVEQSVAVDRLWKFDPQHKPTRRAAHLVPLGKLRAIARIIWSIFSAKVRLIRRRWLS